MQLRRAVIRGQARSYNFIPSGLPPVSRCIPRTRGTLVGAEEAIIRREDDRLVIEPIRKKGLLATLATLRALDEDFPDIDKGMLPLDDVEL